MHPVHPAHVNLGIQVLSGLFAVALCLLLLAGMCLLIFIFTNFITRIIQQTIWPNFLMPKRDAAQGETPQETRAANKKVALDWLLLESQRRRKTANAVTQAEFQEFQQTVEARLQGRKENKGSESPEWEGDLEALQHLIRRGKSQKPISDPLTAKAEFCLVRFPAGIDGPKRYLISKRSERGTGLRVCFAALPVSRALRLDYVSAMRLSKVIPNCFVTAANSYARVWMRGPDNKKQEEKSHAATA